jgi:hypothetical protein
LLLLFFSFIFFVQRYICSKRGEKKNSKQKKKPNKTLQI